MQRKELTRLQKDFGKKLLSLIAQKQYTIEFNQLETQFHIGIQRIGKEIGELSKHCFDLGLPLISVMVINKQTRFCGDGFLDLCNELNYHPEYRGKMETMFNICMDEVIQCKEWYRFADYIGANIDGLGKFSDPILNVIQEEKIEGALIQVNSTSYERDHSLRAECMRIHGTTCKICGFDAGKTYGEKFSGLIHVHHITPLSEIKGSHSIDPKKDLIPVCPNCHMIIHSKKEGVYLPEEVKEMLSSKQ